MKKLLPVFIVLFIMGCAENAHLRIEKLETNNYLIRYNHGALIKSVDPENAMKECCDGNNYKVLDKKQKQLPGQYRLQTSIIFKCEDENEADKIE